MKIEEVEALELKIDAARRYGAFYTALEIASETLSALRDEAWHPIEKAAELGAKDGQRVLLQEGPDWFAGWCMKDRCYDSVGVECFPTHFRFMNPPEGA